MDGICQQTDSMNRFYLQGLTERLDGDRDESRTEFSLNGETKAQEIDSYAAFSSRTSDVRVNGAFRILY